MKKFNKLFGIITVVVVIGLVFAACASAPMPTLNQTVVFVERVRSPLFSGGDMEIYIDRKRAEDYRGRKIELKNGESVAIPVNNGEHLLYAKIGTSQSDAIKVVASGETVNIYAHQTSPYIPIIGANIVFTFTPELEEDGTK
jgi:hypothetical protein